MTATYDKEYSTSFSEVQAGTAADEPRMLFFNGSHDTHKYDAAKQPYETTSWPEILEKARTPAAVEKLSSEAEPEPKVPAFIPSTYHAYDGREHARQRELGEFWLATADVDHGNPTLAAVLKATTAIFGKDTELLIYSSSSASTEDQRWRVLVRLADPTPGEEREILQRAFFSLMAEHGIECDKSLKNAGQPHYLPNVPPSRRDVFGDPEFYHYHHRLGDPANITEPGHAIVIRAKEIMRRDREAQETAAREAAERARQRRERAQREGKSDKVTPLEWYNANHDIEDVLLEHGWKRGKRGSWQSPFQRSGSYATIVRDGHFISLSGSDAAAGLGAPSKNGNAVYGDAYDVYACCVHNNDHSAAWSAIRSMMPKEGRNWSEDSFWDDGTTTAGHGGCENNKAPPDEEGTTADNDRKLQPFNPWSEYSVPPFPLDVLPTAMRRFVEAKADETGACRSAIAMSALVTASGALTHQATVALNGHGQFKVCGRLWALLVGDPSQKKTPAQSGAVAPLREIEKRLQARVIQINRIIRENKDDDQEEEPLPHLIIADTTPEALCEALAPYPRGLLVHADEMSGFFGSMDRYGSGKSGASSRAVWLKAYDGGPHSMIRVSRKAAHVENLSVSVLGGIQPDRLREMGNLASDGLLQRFIPVMMGRAQMSSRTFNGSAYGEYGLLIEELHDYGAFSTSLSPEAAEIRFALEEYLFHLAASDAEGASWQSFVGKQLGHFGSLSILLHCLHGGKAAEPVSGPTARIAERVVREFILPHGLIFFRTVTGSVQDEQRGIAAALAPLEGKTVTLRELSRATRKLRDITSEEIRKKLEPFVLGGWLTPVENVPWNNRWVVTQGLMARFSDEVERHRRYIDEVLSKIIGEGGD